MRYLLLAAAAPLFGSCVTSSDLLRVSAELDGITTQMAHVETVAASNATQSEFEDAVGELYARVEEAGGAIEDVAREVEERTAGVIGGLGAAESGGLIGILSTLGLHMYRNSTRKKVLAVKPGQGGVV